VFAGGPGEHDGEADGGEHEDDGGVGGELGEEVGGAARAEGGLRALAAEGSGEVGGFAGLEQDDSDEEEADDDVEEDEKIDHRECGGPLYFVDSTDRWLQKKVPVAWTGAFGAEGGSELLCLAALAPQAREQCITEFRGASSR
jgi:hypothetical protein